MLAHLLTKHFTMGAPIRCRYSTCLLTFKDEPALIQHMLDEPEHDYCEKCDVACEDWDAYLSHLVQSDKHVACPQCGREMSNVRSIEYHIKRVSHPMLDPSYLGFLLTDCRIIRLRRSSPAKDVTASSAARAT